MKSCLRLAAISGFCLLAIALLMSIANTSKWKDKYETAKNNEKAFSEQLSDAREDLIVYKFTMEQMRHIKDSTIQKMTHVIDSLKLKGKNIQQVQYVSTTIRKTDTLRLNDTLFLEPELCMDTTIGDSWVQTHVHLEYPSTVSVNSSVRSEKVCVVSLKKETVNPPKKTWIGRLFQKKHKVARVNVVEQNPHVENQSSMFIEIVK